MLRQRGIESETAPKLECWFFSVPSHSKVPCSTSAWESSETRSDIAQSRPADRQFSYWPIGLWLSLSSASPSSSAPRSALGNSVAWSALAFLRNFGGLFRKNLFCEERASSDKRPNFLDWLIWHDLAIRRKQREKCVKMVQQENFFFLHTLKNFVSRVRSTAGKKMLVQFKVSDRSEHHCNTTITQCEVQINVLK